MSIVLNFVCIYENAKVLIFSSDQHLLALDKCSTAVKDFDFVFQGTWTFLLQAALQSMLLKGRLKRWHGS